MRHDSIACLHSSTCSLAVSWSCGQAGHRAGASEVEGQSAKSRCFLSYPCSSYKGSMHCLRSRQYHRRTYSRTCFLAVLDCQQSQCKGAVPWLLAASDCLLCRNLRHQGCRSVPSRSPAHCLVVECPFATLPSPGTVAEVPTSYRGQAMQPVGSRNSMQLNI